ncbi:MAG: hypothetical protein EPGJADBJ_05436 [Saprospiraceae bacterium]|nr:hypothetical protein [Saprospiraceae bacterium]
MSKEQKITNNIKVPNKDLETLKIHFPHCFDKDGNFQLEKFKNNLTEKEVSFSTESYGLDWLGKSYARLLASDPATTLLKADETHNSKPENANSENLLIKGDNLEVLKHLANAYYEQVKMIYIDPPYNTGSDGFVYEDDRKFTVKELQNLIGIDAEKAKRILDFTKQKSNSHSAWLTFLYPRLYIAKQLLKDEGVIFVSIDDNEVAQLRLLMDEIFGEENFLAELIWNKQHSQQQGLFKKYHEYVLVYSKYTSSENIKGGEGIIEAGALKKISIKNPASEFKFPAGTRIEAKDGIKFEGTYGDNEKVTVVSGNFIVKGNKLVEDVVLSAGWTQKKQMTKWFNGEETFDTKGQKVIEFFFNSTGKLKCLKERTKITPSTLLPEFGMVSSQTEELTKLLGGNYFENPKPVEMIKLFISWFVENDEIILDFFAGSGTTGHSLIRLNSESEDEFNRKFILVQLPEKIDPRRNKAAYDFVKDTLLEEPTIFEITKERLIRAAKMIQQDKPDYKGDLGFKIFETTPIWEDYNFEAEQFDSSQTLFDVGKLTEDDIKALLTTWKTYDGIALTHELDSIDLSGYTAYYGNGRLYLMHKGFTTDSLKALLEKIDTDKHFEPKSIIAFGYHLESKSLREISENIKTYNNKKKSDIDFITRY